MSDTARDAARRRLMIPTSVIPLPNDSVEGAAVLMRGGPCEGRTGEYVGAYPQVIAVDLGTFGVWTYLKTGEWADVEDFRPGTLEKRLRRGRIYEWNGRDPDGHPI
jgi:hypothetical protein